jgi:hypothetical protein
VRRTRARLAALAVLSLVPIAACSDDAPAPGEASLTVHSGSASIARDGGDRATVTRKAEIHKGDTITVTKGTATLALSNGNQIELRAGVGDHADTKLQMKALPELQAGDALATADEELALDVDGTTVRVLDGSARTSRATGVEVAAYDADVKIESAGQDREVRALREMQVPALGHPPDAPRPFEYDASDPWDRRFLGDAIDLGDRLQALADGYTQNLPARTELTPAFFRSVLSGLTDEPEFTFNLLDPGRQAGETLVGAAIADLGDRGSFKERWRSVFEFRDAGAAWGLVALDQGVERGPLLGAITQAVEASPIPVAGGTTGTTGSSGRGRTTSTTTASRATTPTTVPRTSSGGGGSTPTTPTTVPTPGDPDKPGLLDPLLNPVTDLLTGLINGLLGGLNSSA